MNQIPKRKLGNSDLEVSAVGLGCMGMSFAFGVTPDKQDMISLLHAAVDCWARHWLRIEIKW